MKKAYKVTFLNLDTEEKLTFIQVAETEKQAYYLVENYILEEVSEYVGYNYIRIYF